MRGRRSKAATHAPSDDGRPRLPCASRCRVELGRAHASIGSTQQALGRFFVDLTHVAPAVAARVVTVSPDVASSTNLGAWINRVGVWNTTRASRLVLRRRGDDDEMARRSGAANTSSSASPRATSPACSASSARHGRAGANRCCRSAPSTTRSSPAPSSNGRSASTPVGNRSSSELRQESRLRPRVGRTSPSSPRRSASSSLNASAGSRASHRTWNGRCSTRSASSADPTALGVLPAEHTPHRPIPRRCARRLAMNANTGGDTCVAGGYVAPARRSHRHTSCWSAWGW